MHDKSIMEVIEHLSTKIGEVMFSEKSDNMVRVDYDTAWEILHYLQDFKGLIVEGVRT